MAGLGYNLFVAGQVLTAAQVNGYLQQQTNMVFATAAARDAALVSVKSEGMEAYHLDVNTKAVYTGSGTTWSSIGPVHGARTSWTPACSQGTAVTLTNAGSFVSRVGRVVFADFVFTCTSAGTAGNAVNVTLPIAAAAGNVNFTVFGSASIYDLSGPARHGLVAVMASTGAAQFITNGFGFFGVIPATTLAIGDVLSGQFVYEAAADA